MLALLGLTAGTACLQAGGLVRLTLRLSLVIHAAFNLPDVTHAYMYVQLWCRHFSAHVHVFG
jgi:hypothetical protein